MSESVSSMKKLLNKLGIYDLKSLKTFIFQFFKFGIVGLSNTLIYFSVYYSLVFFGVYYILANFAGFVIGVTNSFYWNRKYVFKQTSEKKRAQFIKVFFAYGFTLVLSTSFLYLMVDIIGISEFIAPVINICITTPINFMLNKFWAFRDSKSIDHQSN